MKKLFLSILSFVILSANAQTVDEIIQKYAANLGGLEAFNNIKTAKMTGTFSTQGNDLPLNIQVINGKAQRTDLEIMGSQIINVFYNGKGWKQNAFAGAASPTDVTDASELNDLKAPSMLASALMDYKARGHKAELTGQEDVEGIKTYKIKLTMKEDGKVTFYYISVSDYTLIKSASDREMMGQTVTLESYYSDLKEFNGVKFFMNRMSKINGEVFQTTTFSNVELNVTIDEKIFEKPKQ